MGSEWSCPCGERNQKKVLHKYTLSEYSSGCKYLIALESLNLSELNDRLSLFDDNYIVSTLSKHPKKKKKILLFYQPPDTIEYNYSPENNYIVLIHKYSSSNELENYIQKKIEKGLAFIGGFNRKGLMKLLFFDTKQPIKTKIIVKSAVIFNINDLKLVIIEEIDKLLIGYIEYQDSIIFIFKELEVPTTFEYLIAEFPKYDDNDDFEKDLVDQIDKSITELKIKFKICIAFENFTYLVFTKHK